ncbi:MAG: hypothetical protein HYV29_01955 [Ignavibacteriales bacterium]|nr:hypothetical protein [Ignavibacteriales bacterium]
MSTSQQQWITFPPNWTWVVVGYCFYILGHLLPLALLYWIMGSGGIIRVIAGAWSFGGLAVVAFIIGYRSRGVTIIEPIIAALVYAATMNVAFSNFWTGTLEINGALWLVLAFVASAISAAMGEMMQHMKTKPS